MNLLRKKKATIPTSIECDTESKNYHGGKSGRGSPPASKGRALTPPCTPGADDDAAAPLSITVDGRPLLDIVPDERAGEAQTLLKSLQGPGAGAKKSKKSFRFRSTRNVAKSGKKSKKSKKKSMRNLMRGSKAQTAADETKAKVEVETKAQATKEDKEEVKAVEEVKEDAPKETVDSQEKDKQAAAVAAAAAVTAAAVAMPMLESAENKEDAAAVEEEAAPAEEEGTDAAKDGQVDTAPAEGADAAPEEEAGATADAPEEPAAEEEADDAAKAEVTEEEAPADAAPKEEAAPEEGAAPEGEGAVFAPEGAPRDAESPPDVSLADTNDVDDDDSTLEPSIEAVEQDESVLLGYYQAETTAPTEEKTEEAAAFDFQGAMNGFSQMMDRAATQTMELGAQGLEMLGCCASDAKAGENNDLVAATGDRGAPEAEDDPAVADDGASVMSVQSAALAQVNDMLVQARSCVEVEGQNASKHAEALREGLIKAAASMSASVGMAPAEDAREDQVEKTPAAEDAAEARQDVFAS